MTSAWMCCGTVQKLTAMVLLGSALSGAGAACPSWPTTERFEFLAGGAEVLDRRTGLVWARCSVGQSWTGSDCRGEVTNLSQEQAMQHAAPLSGWRLPHRRELHSLADRGCLSPAIDTSAFPATPVTLYWSSTPMPALTGDYAMVVDFDSGRVMFEWRTTGAAVRLVRTRP